MAGEAFFKSQVFTNDRLNDFRNGLIITQREREKSETVFHARDHETIVAS